METLDGLKARLDRLLKGNEHALTVALTIAGVAYREPGQRHHLGQRLREAAAQLGIDLHVLLLDRMQECRWDLTHSLGTDLGISVVEAQGLLLTCSQLETPEHEVSELRAAAAELAEAAGSVKLDEAAVSTIEVWVDSYELEEDPRLLSNVASPVSQEMVDWFYRTCPGVLPA
jgi:hypothetical protein